MSLRVSELHAGYVSDIDILRGVSVEARAGRITTIIGANGVGKSTLLRCLVGQLRPHRGSITYRGADLTRTPAHALVGLGIAYLAQRRNVFPQLTVLENLEMGLWSVRRERARVAAALERALDEAPALAAMQARRAGELSGGQQRLLELTRALLTGPSLLLIDEPTVGLDPQTSAQIYAYLKRLRDEQGRAILMVDQNVLAGTAIADYIYVLELGANKLEGTRSEFDGRHAEAFADWLG